MLGIVVPVWVQNEPSRALAVRMAATLVTSRPAHAYFCTNRLLGITPDDFQAQLAAVCPVPVTVLHEPFVQRSVAGAWNHASRQAIAAGATRLLITATDCLWQPDALDALHQWGDTAPRSAALWSGADLLAAVTDEGPCCDFTGVMFRPSLFDRYGWFDERFRQAYYEDNDCAARVWVSGDTLVQIAAARFEHLGSQTIRLDAEAKREVDYWFPRNQARFVAKWGRLPALTALEAAGYYRQPWNRPEYPVSFWDRD